MSEAYRQRGENMLATVRKAVASAGSDGPRESGSGGLLDVDAADQPAVAALSAVLARLVDQGSADGQPQGARAAAMLDIVGSAAWGLVALTGKPWILMEGTRDPITRGHHTKLRSFEAADLHEAREVIVAELQKRRVTREIGQSFERLIRDAQQRSAGQ